MGWGTTADGVGPVGLSYSVVCWRKEAEEWFLVITGHNELNRRSFVLDQGND